MLNREKRASSDDPLLCEPHLPHQDWVLPSARVADEGTYVRLAALFGALADPTRVRIVHMLLGAELCTCDLAGALGITDSAVSQHLRTLRSLQLVRSRRAGKFVYYTLDDAHVSLLIEIGLTHQQHVAEPVVAASTGATP
jgi:DNA-binding transcriptional ArsR family regulator